MADPTDAELDAAAALGEQLASTEPRAASAQYDPMTGRILVELKNGSSFAFPARLGQGLESATDEELARVTVRGSGYGLHWESLDVDLSIPGLVAGIFGTKAQYGASRRTRDLPRQGRRRARQRR